MTTHHRFDPDPDITEEEITRLIKIGWGNKTIAGYLNVERKKVMKLRTKILREKGVTLARQLN